MEIPGGSTEQQISQRCSHTPWILTASVPKGNSFSALVHLSFSRVYSAPTPPPTPRCSILSLKQICTAHFRFNLDVLLLYEPAREWWCHAHCEPITIQFSRRNSLECDYSQYTLAAACVRVCVSVPYRRVWCLTLFTFHTLKTSQQEEQPKMVTALTTLNCTRLMIFREAVHPVHHVSLSTCYQ